MEERIAQLEQELEKLKRDYAVHQHSDLDGTNQLRKSIKLDQDQYLQVGLATHGTAPILNIGTTSEQIQYGIAVGKDDGRTGFVNKLDALQMDFLHQPRNTSLQSFITGKRTPLVSPVGSTSVSTTAAGNTITIDGYNFTTDELAGGLINIYNSSGTLIETQTIASNTGTVITISGTWIATTASATFDIFAPVFLGSANIIWQRFYAQEGTAGGIRFGVGPTNGGQNGLLYMDATGDLYWRPKTGAAVKLN